MRSTRKLAVSIISLLVVFFMLVTSTYAWIASSNSISIGQISFTSSSNDSYLFSLDGGKTYVKSFDGDDIYISLQNMYPDYENYFCEKINTGSVANPNYEYRYRFVYNPITLLAKQTGFVSKFYTMQHTIIDNEVAFVFHNQTDIYDDNSQILYNQYNPTKGYVRFPLTIKSTQDSFIYLNNYEIMMNGRTLQNDIVSTSMLRIGFESDLYNKSKLDNNEENEYYVEEVNQEIEGVKNNIDRHLKILEPVKKIDESLSSFLGGILENTTGVGSYFSKAYIDDFAHDMRKEGSLLKINPLDNDSFTFNNEYVNKYGTDLDKKYDFKWTSQIIEEKKSDLNKLVVDYIDGKPIYRNLDSEYESYLKATPIVRLEKNIPQTMNVYIWLEGWDGAAGDFSQLGRFSFSMSFIEVKL